MDDLTFEFARAIDAPWRTTECIQVGEPRRGEPAIYLLVSGAGVPVVRLDVFSTLNGPLSRALSWGGFIFLGGGVSCFCVNLQKRRIVEFELGCYFAGFYPTPSYLLVATSESLVRINTRGTVDWDSRVDFTSNLLGIDGVVVHEATEDVIKGEGEWDPPGGWRPFVVNARTGLMIDRARPR